jgi:hypothetical protein
MATHQKKRHRLKAPPILDIRPLLVFIYWHLSLSWLTLLCACAFYLLTIIYTWHPTTFSQYKIIGGSATSALGFLAILVQLGGLCFAAALSQALGVLSTCLAARVHGIRFEDYLALHPATGFEGWCDIIRRRPWYRFQPHFWSGLRYLCIAIVPLLGVVINGMWLLILIPSSLNLFGTMPGSLFIFTLNLSHIDHSLCATTNNRLVDVGVALDFYPVPTFNPLQAHGTPEFNSSLAPLIQPIADILFSARFWEFISDPSHSIDMSEDADYVNCVNPGGLQKGCRKVLFTPSGIGNFVPPLLKNHALSDSSSILPILVVNDTGYRFEFQDFYSIDDYGDQECVKIGDAVGAIRICLRNKDPNKVQACTYHIR